MRIHIIGAGPAGLYFAIRMKNLDPAHEITVLERDGPADTFGWGIVFSDQTFGYLEAADAPSYREIVAACETWDNVDVVVGDEKVTIGGNRFSGISRLRFLQILQARCRALDVELAYHRTFTDADPLPPCDLLVGADGANSTIRRRFSDHFQPSISFGGNKYIWLGTRRLFHGLTLTFRRNEAGVFAAHSYKFSPDRSTFIVECSEETWARVGFAAMSERETCAYLEGVFASDLHGAPLLANNFVRWGNFVLVRNGHWSYQHVVLLGDALHTAHFSIGSGTKLALEDAIALADALGGTQPVEDALRTFERARRPRIEAYQEAATDSRIWFERAGDLMHLPPIAFAFRLMTRSGKIDLDKLRARDPRFIARYEESANGN